MADNIYINTLRARYRPVLKRRAALTGVIKLAICLIIDLRVVKACSEECS